MEVFVSLAELTVLLAIVQQLVDFASQDGQLQAMELVILV
jgi:hypothetical protein